MNKFIRFLITFILLLISIDFIYPEKKKLTIIAGDSFIPYSFYSDEGFATGTDIDYLKAIAEKLSLEIDFILTPWETAFDRLLTGDGDVVLSVTPSEERASYLDFSTPYLSLKMYIFFNKNMENIFKKSDLNNIPVGMPKGTPYELIFREIAINPVFYNGYENVYKAAANNQIPAVFSPDVTGSYFLAKLGVHNMFKRMNNPIWTEELTMAVRKGDTETLNLINKGIKLLRKNEYEKIIQNFIGVEVKLIEKIDFKLLIVAVLCILLVISIIIAWNILLRKNVISMTRELHEEKENIKKSLNEKEVLLQEVNHRVKNNLNVIISLLNLKADSIVTGKDAIEAFEESRDLVYSMAMVHEELYQSNDFTEIKIKDYIENLVVRMIEIYQPFVEIKYKLQITDANIDITKAIPCGMILTELVTNALKHAFNNKNENGFLEISCIKSETGNFNITVKDNGPGLPDDIDIQNPDSSGLQLVNILTSQIGGHLSLKRKNFTEFIINFPG